MNIDNELDKSTIVGIIVDIIKDKGIEILSDKNTFFALLSDLYHDHKREIFLLQCLWNESSFLFLWERWASSSSDFTINTSKIRNDLHNNYFIDNVAVDWIMSLWNDVFLTYSQDKKEEKSSSDIPIENKELISLDKIKLLNLLKNKEEIINNLNNQILDFKQKTKIRNKRKMTFVELLFEVRDLIKTYYLSSKTNKN